jgi:hypothetical protein
MKTEIAKLAKQLRDELKKEFPGFTFEVRSRSYSMGSSIDVYWVDGMIRGDVENITKKYEDISYDSFTGEILSGGNRYVQVSRSYSDNAIQSVINEFKNNNITYGDSTGINLEDADVTTYKRGGLTWETMRLITHRLDEIDFTKNNHKNIEKINNDTAVIQPVNIDYSVKYEGLWTWLYFTGKPDESIRQSLKDHGFRFSGKRIAWYSTNKIEESEIKSWLVDTSTNNTNDDIIDATIKITEEKPANNLKLAEK